ncbi:MAG: nucleotide exchange factor GrpE [Actinobacteria bacterium]|nr:nucleotide exchange factor GrpE [Actinomycetota bacterium]
MTTSSEDASIEVLGEVRALRDLFHRRLLNDSAKAKAIELLREEVEFQRSGLAATVLAPIFRDLIPILDRLMPLQDEVSVSIVDELSELFERHGVRRIPTLLEGDEPVSFDPRHHNGARSQDCSDLPPNRVVAELRTGYLLGEVVLRPADVVVSSRPTAAAGLAWEG